MKLKTFLLLFTGFCLGTMMQESLLQLRWRNYSVGGELLFLPMVILLVWLGWTLKTEALKARRFRNGNTRRK